jgi:ribonuclease HI
MKANTEKSQLYRTGDLRYLWTMILVYTDGGCYGNPGPGAWAYVLEIDGKLIDGSGGVKRTTNNRMELTAVIHALGYILSQGGLKDQEVDLYTDSMYVKKGITEWIDSWLQNGWRNKAKKPVKNKELWMRLLSLTGQLRVRWHWTPGHSGNELNELCDRLVQEKLEKSV